MLKKLFSGSHAGPIVVVLFGLGALFWGAAFFVPHSQPMFYTAAALFCAGFLWTLGWIWHHSAFIPRKKYKRRYSDQLPQEHSDRQATEYLKTHPERRRRSSSSSRGGKRRLRWLAIAACFVAFLALGVEFYTSYKGQMEELEQQRVQIFISDPEIGRTLTLRAPVIGPGDYAKDMMFALVGIPTHEVVIRKSDTTVRVDVVVRNNGNDTLRNVHIRIDSDVEINPATKDMKSLTPTELGIDLPEIASVDHGGKELTYTVEVPIPEFQNRPGLFVTVKGDNLQPFAAAAKIMFINHLEPVKQAHRPQPAAPHPATPQ